MAKHGSAPETFKGQYNAFPRAVDRSAAVVSLSDSAYRLLHNALDMHTGKNNGHIALTLAKLAAYGWNSKQKLTRATHELLDRELLVLTRQGGMGLGPSLFALGWLRIHSYLGLDITPNSYQQGAWLDYQHGASPGPAAGVGELPKGVKTLDPLRGRTRTRSGGGAGPAAGAGVSPLDPLRGREVTNKLKCPPPYRGTVTELPVVEGANAPDVVAKNGADIGGMLG